MSATCEHDVLRVDRSVPSGYRCCACGSRAVVGPLPSTVASYDRARERGRFRPEIPRVRRGPKPPVE